MACRCRPSAILPPGNLLLIASCRGLLEDSSTRDLIFSVPQIISFLSIGTRLLFGKNASSTMQAAHLQAPAWDGHPHRLGPSIKRERRASTARPSVCPLSLAGTPFGPGLGALLLQLAVAVDEGEARRGVAEGRSPQPWLKRHTRTRHVPSVTWLEGRAISCYVHSEAWRSGGGGSGGCRTTREHAGDLERTRVRVTV